jgi:hypothetical protein
MLVAAIVLVLLLVSTASAGRLYVIPARAAVTYSYWPVGPVYAYPAPAVVAAPAPVVVPAVAPAPVVVFPRAYVYGRPVRSVVRYVLPY